MACKLIWIQKQAAVDKANKELESVEARIAHVEAALLAAQKGKEDTVSLGIAIYSLLVLWRFSTPYTTPSSGPKRAITAPSLKQANTDTPQPERQKLLISLSTARTNNTELKSELAAYGAADPVKYDRKKRAIEVCKQSALRWTGKSTSGLVSLAEMQRAS